MKTKTLQTLYLLPDRAVIKLTHQPDDREDLKFLNTDALNPIVFINQLLGEPLGDTLDLGECPGCEDEPIAGCDECTGNIGRLKRTVKAVRLVQVKSLFVEYRGTPHGRIMDDLHKDSENAETYVILVELQ